MEQLLTLFNRFSRLVKEAFQDDPRFLTARDKVSFDFCLGCHCRVHVLEYFITFFFFLTSSQAYKAVVNDATIFKLELPMKQKG